VNIRQIVQEAFTRGYLAPANQARLERQCDSAEEVSGDDYLALQRLQKAMASGEIVAFQRKDFRNVMEELVETEAVLQVASLGADAARAMNLGDAVAYALNRLPPLYATSDQGAKCQRERAGVELRILIGDAVREAVARSLAQPAPFASGGDEAAEPPRHLIGQLSDLLGRYRSSLEQFAIS